MLAYVLEASGSSAHQIENMVRHKFTLNKTVRISENDHFKNSLTSKYTLIAIIIKARRTRLKCGVDHFRQREIARVKSVKSSPETLLHNML